MLLLVAQVGIEPTSADFQSAANTASATEPYNGTSSGIRTLGLVIKNHLLYQLS